MRSDSQPLWLYGFSPAYAAISTGASVKTNHAVVNAGVDLNRSEECRRRIDRPLSGNERSRRFDRRLWADGEFACRDHWSNADRDAIWPDHGIAMALAEADFRLLGRA